MAKLDKATFACGCFWGVQQAFDETAGVVKTTVGYTGGHLQNPTYENVCYDDTGHAEACEVEFDPKKVSYEKLLEKFWSIHDPTQFHRQGPDVGSQYRSAIFSHGEKQGELAEKSKKQLQKKLDEGGEYAGKKIVTEITAAPKFWPAEDYHQKYYLKHPGAVCHV